ncbi:MAG TPA: CDP-alcohol phosphatidyltransferase family protein [Kofleriaceae bacterium]|jgi:phosphatidylglycerophosphate synthase
MWLAHALTLARLPLALALTQTFGDRAWSALIVVLAAATDAADGTVARAMKKRGSTGPDIGGWLDPVVDKIFVVIVLITIYVHTHDIALLALIAAREILMVPLMLVYVLRGRPVKTLHARPIGKVATIVQFFACAVAVVDIRYAWPLAIAAAVLGAAAIADYIIQELTGPQSSSVRE